MSIEEEEAKLLGILLGETFGQGIKPKPRKLVPPKSANNKVVEIGSVRERKKNEKKRKKSKLVKASRKKNRRK